jgi:hypothetical protein
LTVYWIVLLFYTSFYNNGRCFAEKNKFFRKKFSPNAREKLDTYIKLQVLPPCDPREAGKICQKRQGKARRQEQKRRQI